MQNYEIKLWNFGEILTAVSSQYPFAQDKRNPIYLSSTACNREISKQVDEIWKILSLIAAVGSIVSHGGKAEKTSAVRVFAMQASFLQRKQN